jgi:hypothetical protein
MLLFLSLQGNSIINMQQQLIGIKASAFLNEVVCSKLSDL